MTNPADAPLSSDAIRVKLKTRTIGATLAVREDVDSTNRLLAEMARADAPDGLVVVADSQTAGRGRLGRPWVSPRGMNIYTSVLLRHPAVEGITWIPLLAAVAVARSVQLRAGLSVKIKWPNDVLVIRDGQGRKLAGILVEAVGSDPGKRAVIAGIGINVNMPVEAFPEDLRAGATSILIETGCLIPRIGLFTAMLEELERLYDQFCKNGVDELARSYRDLSDTLGKKVGVELAGGQRMEGRAEDLAPDGALLLSTGQGKIVEIRAGDVVHLR